MNQKLWFLVVIGCLFIANFSFAQSSLDETQLLDLQDADTFKNLVSESDKGNSNSSQKSVKLGNKINSNESTDKNEDNSEEFSDVPRLDQLSVKDLQKINDPKKTRGQTSKHIQSGSLERKKESSPTMLESKGNLPSYARRRKELEREFLSPSVETSSSSTFSLQDLKRGTVLKAVIDGSIVGYPDAEAPVSAIVTSPEKYRNAHLLGNANLDLATKRINIEFHTLVLPSVNTPYSINGITSDRSGRLGIEGVHRTDYWNWLMAEVAVKSASGLIEASAVKEQSIFGTTNSVTPENTVRKGVSTGLNTMGERFGEKRLKAIEITEVSGPTLIQVSIFK